MRRHVPIELTFHEDLRRHFPSATSSNRAFGLVFAVVFGAIALWPLRSGGVIRLWAAVMAACFLLPAIFRPSLLGGLNRWWTRFGLLLTRVVHPVVIAVLFFGAFTPVGFFLRLFGHDPLRRRFDPDATTYWIARTAPGTMRKQF